MMRRDPALRAACQAADMAVADGMSVVWALRALGRPVPERVAGIDLMTSLLAAGSTERLRVYLLGARQEVLDALVRECGRRYPGLVIAGARNGYFTAGRPRGDRRGDSGQQAGHALRRYAEPVQGRLLPAASGPPRRARDHRRRRQLRRRGRVHQARAEGRADDWGSSGRGDS